jgi:Ca2+-binding EF-hand superfamily protein
MAMLYTPQQLAGGGKYSRGVRVGNWAEDIDYADEKIRDYMARRGRGDLASSKEAARMGVLMQEVPHSFSSDGSLRYGDTIVVESVATNGEITGDHFRETSWGSGESYVNVKPRSKGPWPTASCTLVITRDDDAIFEGKTEAKVNTNNILCFGDYFYLCSNPSLRVDPRTGMLRPPLFLKSTKRGLTSGLDGMQPVSMTNQCDAACRWKVCPTDRAKEVLYEGKPVPANQPVLLLHKGSHEFLGTSSELEEASGTKLICKAFRAGTSRKALVLSEENHWILRTSDSAEKARDNRKFLQMTPELVLEKVRVTINERGHHAIRGLGRSFRIMDDGGDGMLDREDFRFGLADYGVHLSDSEFDMVMNIFDGDKDGFVSFDEFLVTLRGPMSERRMDFVRQAYALLDKNGDGTVTLADLKSIYDVSQSPDVISGRKTEQEALEEFASQWDKDHSGVVSLEEFTEYYRDVSASIDDDDYFELMMRNAWHISGGKGWLQNTTCRRVLVIHTDDSQTVEEIQNDLGIGPQDIDKMRERLVAQGVVDIKAIKLTE